MFWLGFAEGLNQQLDRNLQREIWLGKENSETRDRVHRARLGTIKSIVEGRAKEVEEYKAHVRVIEAFEDRLESLESPEERAAYLNILKEDPEYAASLLSNLMSFEGDKEGVRIEGQRLVEMVDLIEETQPSNLTRDEYVADVARAAVDMQGGIRKYDSLWEAVMAEDDENELVRIQAEADAGWAPEGGLGIPDPDYSGINVRPSTQKDVGTLLKETAKARLDQTLQGIEQKIADVGGKVEFLSPEERATYEELRGLDAQLQDNPDLILQYPAFTAPAYREIQQRSPEIDNSAYNIYNPARTEQVVAPSPAVPSQPAPAVPVAPAPAPPVITGPSNIEGGVMVPPPLVDPAQQETLTTPPEARRKSWSDIFGGLF